MSFLTQLAHYQKIINHDIAAYAGHVRSTTPQQFGQSSVVTNAYLDLLEAGGKRLRGALVIVGYEMCGGKDHAMIARAATAIEMLHTYLLIIDDIQDESDIRRGQPSVHQQLVAYAREQQLTNPKHTGLSLAINAALGGAHAAHMLLAGLSVDPELRLKALGIINLAMLTAAHGQSHDIITAASQDGDEAELLRTMEWKTANYSFLNPLCTGMALAGAGCEDTDAIRDYALHTGIAFQIMDDLADDEVQLADPELQAAQHVEAALQALNRQAHRWPSNQVDFLRDLTIFIGKKGT